MKEKILILYNLAKRLEKGVPSDLLCELEITIIVPLMVALLEARGYRVQTLPTGSYLWETLKRKKKKKEIDLVFNLAEAFGGGNSKEPVVPAILEALGIPFTGASARNMHLTLDKEMTKLVVAAYGIPTAPYQLFRNGKEPLSDALCFPLIVKPVREEASIGIHENCVVMDEPGLRRKIEESIANYQQPALVESFVFGREISVGVLGNRPDLHVFPPLEFLFEGTENEFGKIRSYEYKWGGKKEQMIRADLPCHTISKLEDYTRKAFEVTECRDYARMDYRLDAHGTPILLEVNYNPGIGPNTHGLNNTLTMMAGFSGWSFEELVEQVIRLALARA